MIMMRIIACIQSLNVVPEYPESFALWFQTNGGVVNTFTQVSESSWEFFDKNGSTSTFKW